MIAERIRELDGVGFDWETTADVLIEQPVV